MSSSEWSDIESDPAVFTDIIETMGVKDVQVKELYALDDDFLAQVVPAFGLIFLFKWDETVMSANREAIMKNAIKHEDTDPDLFYARQIIRDACATQALLSVVLNAPGVDVGNSLRDFKEFTREFPPDLKGEAIGDNTVIRDAHNRYARPEVFYRDSSGKARRPATKDDEVYHFVAFIPFKGDIYELDGLKPGPVRLGKIEDASGREEEGGAWLRAVRPHIEERIAQYGGAIHFTLLAVIRNRETVVRERITACVAAGDEAAARALEEELEEEREARRVAQAENVRRRHNYIPFVVEALKVLERKGKLEELVAKARVKDEERRRRAAAAEEAAKSSMSS